MSKARYEPTDADIDKHIDLLRQHVVSAIDNARELDISPIQAAMLQIQSAIQLGGAVVRFMHDAAPEDVVKEAVEALVDSIMDDINVCLPVRAAAQTLPHDTDLDAVMGAVEGMTRDASEPTH